MMTHRELEREIEEVKTRAHLMQIERDAWIEAHREAMQIIAALRKALEDALHDPDCATNKPYCPDCGSSEVDCRCAGYYSGTKMKERPCDCWKSRIPEAA